jgi:hypothetical protein
MREDAKMNQELSSSTLVKAKISKVKFPEKCPVCLGEPEDLVSVTIKERSSTVMGDEGPVFMWTDGREMADRIMAARFIAWAALIVLFYPVLYFVLGINVAIWNSRPLLEPVAGLTVILLLLFVLAVYGYYPRALERSLKFIDIDKAKNTVYIDIKNDEYRKLFMDLNAMHADVIHSIEDESLK